MGKIMKKLFATMFVATLTLSCLSGVVFASTLSGTGTEETPYLIGSSADMDLFKAEVNASGSEVYAKLTEDITVTSTETGYGLGTSTNPFKGTFDGNGHTITLAINAGNTGYAVGLFDYTEDATIKNLKLAGSIKSSSTNTNYVDKTTDAGLVKIGAVVGIAKGGIFENIVSAATVDATAKADDAHDDTNSKIGGLIGYTAGMTTSPGDAPITMSKCAVIGDVKGPMYSAYIGGLIGDNAAWGNRVYDCYVTGTLTGGNPCCGLSVSGWFECCFVYSDMIGAFSRRQTTKEGGGKNLYVNSEYATTGGGTHSNTVGGGSPTAATKAQFASGEIAFLLNQVAGGNIFRQNIGADQYPGFEGKVVIQNASGYANESGADRDSIEEGEEALTGEGTTASPYTIDNIKKLNKFRSMVNAGNSAGTYAKLTEDITVTSTETSYGLGTSTNPFKGTFDGNGHTITLAINAGNTGYAVGLFDYTEDATIKNLKLAGSIKSSSTNTNYVDKTTDAGLVKIGAVVGIAKGGIFENIVSAATVDATAKADDAHDDTNSKIGGLIGYTAGMTTSPGDAPITMSKCAVIGDVKGPMYSAYIGGLIGDNAAWGNRVYDCYVTGTLTGGNPCCGLSVSGWFECCFVYSDMIGAFSRRQTTKEGGGKNLYVNSEYATTGGGTHSNTVGGGSPTAATKAQFADGTVLSLLNASDTDRDGKPDYLFTQGEKAPCFGFEKSDLSVKDPYEWVHPKTNSDNVLLNISSTVPTFEAMTDGYAVSGMNSGNYIGFKNLDFGEGGAYNIEVAGTSAGNVMEVWIDTISAAEGGLLVATLDDADIVDGEDRYYAELNNVVANAHNVFFKLIEGENYSFKGFKFEGFVEPASLEVKSVSPTAGSEIAPDLGRIDIAFNNNVDEETVDGNIYFESVDGVRVDCTATVENSNVVLKFPQLDNGTAYKLIITSGVKSHNGYNAEYAEFEYTTDFMPAVMKDPYTKWIYPKTDDGVVHIDDLSTASPNYYKRESNDKSGRQLDGWKLQGLSSGGYAGFKDYDFGAFGTKKIVVNIGSAPGYDNGDVLIWLDAFSEEDCGTLLVTHLRGKCKGDTFIAGAEYTYELPNIISGVHDIYFYWI